MDNNTVDESACASPIRQLIAKFQLHFCAPAFGNHDTPTYISDAHSCQSTIDHFLVSNIHDVASFEVLDPVVNYSDHVPIVIKYLCALIRDDSQNGADTDSPSNNKSSVKYHRWDHADIMSYYYYTGDRLRGLFDMLDKHEATSVSETTIDSFYNDIVDMLNHYADCYVPKRSSSFYKFWWSEELDLLKSNAVQTCAAWRSVGRPRSGSIFNQYRADKQLYKRAIDEHKRDVAYLCTAMNFMTHCLKSKVLISGVIGVPNLETRAAIFYMWMVFQMRALL